MKNNPLLLEGFVLLGRRKIWQILILLYLSLFTIGLVLNLSSMNNNIFSEGFNPPDLFDFIIKSGQISSSVFLVLSYSILFFKSEKTLNWFEHGGLSALNIFTGRFLYILVITIIVELLSLPWIIFAARISAVPISMAMGAIVINSFVVFTYGQVWILAGFLIIKNKVFQIIFIFTYVFIYLLVSAKILPSINPVLLLNTVYNSLPLGFSVLYINLFLFCLTLITVFIVHLSRVVKYEK